MDEVDTPVRPRRPRAKNSFQLEIESKLKERRAKGLVADLTSEESEEDSMNGKYCCFSYQLCAVLIYVLYFLLGKRKEKRKKKEKKEKKKKDEIIIGLVPLSIEDQNVIRLC